MARNETDREDLIREATALVQRGEWRVPGEAEPVVAGFHRDGRLSVYFGADPVFHFEPDGSLRRAFFQGDLYRSQGSTLARLRRRRTETTSELQRHDLEGDELSDLLAAMRLRLDRFRQALQEQQAVLMRQIPEGANLAGLLPRVLTLASQGRLSPALRK
ncbi:MAG: hypothetical protein ACKV0T_20405 [Planctomycetales bacterium]